MKSRSLLAAIWLIASAASAFAQTTEFTYQGKLNVGGVVANGSHDFEFRLFDALSAGNQLAVLTRNNVTVTDGIFAVNLDFGAAAFPGASRFLEIFTRPAGGGGFNLLSPRQPITSTPYAIRSLNVAVAGIPPGSGNYIQNSASPQPSSDFNISGTGRIGGNLGVGTSIPATKLDVRGDLTLDSGANPVLFTAAAGGEQNRFLELINSPASQSASGLKAGGVLVSDSYNFADPGKNDLIVKGRVGIGTGAPLRTLQIGARQDALFTIEGSDSASSAGYVRFGDGTGWQLHFGRSRQSAAGALITGTTGTIMTIVDNQPSGFCCGSVIFNAGVQLEQIYASGASPTPLCRNSLNLISVCSSSRRYKTAVEPLRGGLRLVNHLRPVSFQWKENEQPDIGLIAEEVAQVDPRLAFRNQTGQIEGVNYFQLTAVLANAVKEQQKQIEQLKAQVRQLQRQSRKHPPR